MAALTSRLIDQVNISHIARDAESNLCLRAGHREALKLLFRRATETSDPAAKDAIIAWMHHFDKMSFNHENEHLVEFCVNAVLQLLQRAPHQHASLGSALCRFIERLDASEELRAVLDKLTGVPQEDGFSRSVLTTSSLPAFCGVLRALGTSEAPLPLPADQTSMISKVLFSFLSQLSDAHADAEVSPEAEASAANLKSLLLYVLRRCLGQPEMLQSLQLKAPQADLSSNQSMAQHLISIAEAEFYSPYSTLREASIEVLVSLAHHLPALAAKLRPAVMDEIEQQGTSMSTINDLDVFAALLQAGITLSMIEAVGADSAREPPILQHPPTLLSSNPMNRGNPTPARSTSPAARSTVGSGKSVSVPPPEPPSSQSASIGTTTSGATGAGMGAASSGLQTLAGVLTKLLLASKRLQTKAPANLTFSHRRRGHRMQATLTDAGPVDAADDTSREELQTTMTDMLLEALCCLLRSEMKVLSRVDRPIESSITLRTLSVLNDTLYQRMLQHMGRSTRVAGLAKLARRFKKQAAQKRASHSHGKHGEGHPHKAAGETANGASKTGGGQKAADDGGAAAIAAARTMEEDVDEVNQMLFVMHAIVRAADTTDITEWMTQVLLGHLTRIRSTLGESGAGGSDAASHTPQNSPRSNISTSTDRLVWPFFGALAELAAVKTAEGVYGRVISTLLTGYRNCTDDPFRQGVLAAVVPKALHRAAELLRRAASPVRADFRRELLLLFLRVGLEMQALALNPPKHESRASWLQQCGATLGALLPAVAQAVAPALGHHARTHSQHLFSLPIRRGAKVFSPKNGTNSNNNSGQAGTSTPHVQAFGPRYTGFKHSRTSSNMPKTTGSRQTSGSAPANAQSGPPPQRPGDGHSATERREAAKDVQGGSVASTKLYRNVWFQIMLFGFGTDPSWPRHWKDALTVIAATSPALVVHGASNYLALDLSASAIVKRGVPDDLIAQLRQELAARVPPFRAAPLKQCSVAELLFLSAVLDLESYRAAVGNFKGCMLYLADEGINATPNLILGICAISSAVFRTYVRGVRNVASAQVAEDCLLDHLQFLLAACTHRILRVRLSAFRFCIDLISAFPHLLWHRQASSTLLNIIEAVTQRTQQGNNPALAHHDAAHDARTLHAAAGAHDMALKSSSKTAFADSHGASASLRQSEGFTEAKALHVVGCAYPLHVPGAQSVLAGIAADLVDLAKLWFGVSGIIAPSDTRAALEQYVQGWSQRNQRLVDSDALAGHELSIQPDGPPSTRLHAGPTISMQAVISSLSRNVPTSLPFTVPGALVAPVPALGAHGQRTSEWDQAFASVIANSDSTNSAGNPWVVRGIMFTTWGQRVTGQMPNIAGAGPGSVGSSRSLHRPAPVVVAGSQEVAPWEAGGDEYDDRMSAVGGRGARADIRLSQICPSESDLDILASASLASVLMDSAISTLGQSLPGGEDAVQEAMKVLSVDMSANFLAGVTRRTHFTGQIEGMASFHRARLEQDLSHDAPTPSESFQAFVRQTLQSDLSIVDDAIATDHVQALLAASTPLHGKDPNAHESEFAPSRPDHAAHTGWRASLVGEHLDDAWCAGLAVHWQADGDSDGEAEEHKDASTEERYRPRRASHTRVASTGNDSAETERLLAAAEADQQGFVSSDDEGDDGLDDMPEDLDAMLWSEASRADKKPDMGQYLGQVGRQLRLKGTFVKRRLRALVARQKRLPPVGPHKSSSKGRVHGPSGHQASDATPNLTSLEHMLHQSQVGSTEDTRAHLDGVIHDHLEACLFRGAAYLVWNTQRRHTVLASVKQTMRARQQAAHTARRRYVASEDTQLKRLLHLCKVDEEADVTEVLPKLVWTPVRVFTPRALQMAVDCWEWLLTSIADDCIRLRLMREIGSAWKWTIQQSYGLFRPAALAADDPGHRKPKDEHEPDLFSHPMPDVHAATAGIRTAQSSDDHDAETAQTATQDAAYAGDVTCGSPSDRRFDDTEPHRTWVSFFGRRLRVTLSAHVRESAVVGQALVHALQVVPQWSCAPGAFGLRIRILHLSMLFLQLAHRPYARQMSDLGTGIQRPGPQLGLFPAGSGALQPNTVGLADGSGAEDSARFDMATTPERRPSMEAGRAGDSADARSTDGLKSQHSGPDGAMSDVSQQLPSATGLMLGGLGAWNGAQPGQDDALVAYSTAGREVPHQFVRQWTITSGYGSSPTEAEERVATPESMFAVSIGSLKLFRDRILHAALMWFALKPSFYEVHSSPERVRLDFPYITSFLQLLHADCESLQSSGTIQNLAIMRARTCDIVDSADQLAETSPNGVGAGGIRAAQDASFTTQGSIGPRGKSGARGGLDSIMVSRRGSGTGSPEGDSGPGSHVGSVALGGFARRLSRGFFVKPRKRSTHTGSGLGGGQRRTSSQLGTARDQNLLTSVIADQVSRARSITAASSSARSEPPTLLREDSLGASTRQALHEETFRAVNRVRARIQLVCVLFGHEIDRIVAWHNPTRHPAKFLPGEQQHSWHHGGVKVLPELTTLNGLTSAFRLAQRNGYGYTAGSIFFPNNLTGDAAIIGGPSHVIGGAAPATAGTTGKTFDKHAWSSLISVAWKVDPQIALRIACRWRGLPWVQEAVEAIVQADPAAARHLPEAIPFIVTPETVANGSSCLRQLLYWAPASMPIVLRLLTRSDYAGNLPAPLFAHPSVAAFVVRSLSRFAPQIIVFYVPQLVQAIRHDASGKLSDFLFGISQQSAHIAHQLLWTLVAESKSDTEDEADKSRHPKLATAPAKGPSAVDSGSGTEDLPGDEGAKPSPVAAANGRQANGTTTECHGFQHALPGTDPLPERASKLIQRIQATFSPAEQALFDLQYTFWDDITDVSGRLKREVSEKTARNRKIAEFLKDMRHKSKKDLQRALAVASEHTHTQQRAWRRQARREYAASTPASAATATSEASAADHRPPEAELQGPSKLAVMPKQHDFLPMNGVYPGLGGAAQVLGAARLNGDNNVLYLPTNPYWRVVGVNMNSGRAMQSAAKCPFLLSFAVKPFAGPDSLLAQLRSTEESELAQSAQDREAQRQLQFYKLTSGDDGSARARLRQSTKAITTAARRMRDQIMPKKGKRGEQKSRSSITSELGEIKLTEAEAEGEEAGRRAGRGGGGQESDSEESNHAADEAVKSPAQASAPHTTTDEVDSQASDEDPVASPSAPRRRHNSEHSYALEADLPPAPSPADIAESTLACIFKVYDDCRQDALALQVMKLLQELFESADLGLALFPYRVIPTRVGKELAVGGIIECVPGAKSLDELGKAGHANLYQYFVHTFGAPTSQAFEAARRNMIRSLAAYAVACYVLWIKDRHNGNIMVNDKGHLIHIDFGFLLGISPGGNLGFETAAFKLTQEMVAVMGGSTDSEMFTYFTELVCRAFMAAREEVEGTEVLVAGMADSGLPCYLFPDCLGKLRGRFRPQDSPLQAAEFMKAQVLGARNRTTTVLYDGIQKLQNNIYSEAWK